MKHTIEVTQEDIHKDKRVECYLCPVALAMKRTFGRKWGISQTFFASGDIVVDCPIEAKGFIFAFDCEQKVKPFTFELEIPE